MPPVPAVDFSIANNVYVEKIWARAGLVDEGFRSTAVLAKTSLFMCVLPRGDLCDMAWRGPLKNEMSRVRIPCL